MANSAGIKSARSSYNAVNFIPLGKQKLCQIRTILAGYAGYKSFFHWMSFVVRISLFVNSSDSNSKQSLKSQLPRINALLILNLAMKANNPVLDNMVFFFKVIYRRRFELGKIKLYL